MLRLLFTLALLSALGGSVSSALGQGPSPRAALIAADQELSQATFRSGVPRAYGDAFADSVVLLLEGAPIIAGRERALQHLNAQPGLKTLRLQRIPLIVAVSEDGNYGATSGATILSRAGRSADSLALTGHYISVWRRDEAGPWKMVAVLENGLADADSIILAPLLRDRGSPPPLTGAARAMADADIAFAKLAADSGAPVAFGSYAAPDATFPPAPMTITAAAIQARLEAGPSARSVWVWQPVYASAARSGDLGFSVGESAIRASTAPDAATYYGKYLTVWRRQPDGSYKFILDAGNDVRR